MLIMVKGVGVLMCKVALSGPQAKEHCKLVVFVRVPRY